MVKVFEGTENQYWIDGYLKENLDIAKKIIKKDWDMLFVYDGNEGSGKSVKAIQDAYYCDPTLTIERVVFTPEEFKKAILNADKYTAVVYDEAYTGLSSRATMSLINRSLVSMLAEIRQRNLFVFIVLPCFFDLDKYVALWRSRALIHVYTGEQFQRGKFCFFNIDRKKDLYMLGKKFYSYSRPKANFHGEFSPHYCIDEEAYRQKKKTSLLDKADNKEQTLTKAIKEIIFRRLIRYPPETKLSMNIKSEIIGISKPTYYKMEKEFKEEPIEKK
jgi:hypothetical protein|tara:strand:+ start:472 stop:1293 length:822 start_codon:yes stop_codon:yes gene_type:complete